MSGKMVTFSNKTKMLGLVEISCHSSLDKVWIDAYSMLLNKITMGIAL